MKKLTILFLILFPLLTFSSSNEQIISGYVYDSSNKSPLPGVMVRVKDKPTKSVSTNVQGYFKISLLPTEKVLQFSFIGFITKELSIKNTDTLKVFLEQDTKALNEVVIVGYGATQKQTIAGRASGIYIRGINTTTSQFNGNFSTETYNAVAENGFKTTVADPLSTFSVDVDAASYSNIRRFLQRGQLPVKDAVRIEEMINYFSYDYPEPLNGNPIAVHTDVTQVPWNKEHHLVKIGLKAKSIDNKKLPPANLVFLIDVSGSMQGPDRIELLKTSFKLLTDQLRPQDHVAIVVYAGAAGLVLPTTSGADKAKIKEAINNLNTGGSTAGGAGIKLAYQTARESFKEGGNNRIILATDGDFNVGVSSDGEMQRLIEENRNDGIFLTVLGFGTGNLKDSKMEAIADKGNGNYAFIDNMNEAKKVLVNEFGATIFTVAKDVKLQVEFNPAKVKAYRLIGYENRLLNKEDFKDDKKDAGDMGAGHTVTALYEVIPQGVKSDFIKDVDELKYQKSDIVKNSSELLTVNIRYKNPGDEKSKLITHVVADKVTDLEKASEDLKFASAIATFGMLLKDSEYKQKSAFESLILLAQEGKGKDKQGYRAEFIQLAENAKLLIPTDKE